MRPSRRGGGIAATAAITLWTALALFPFSGRALFVDDHAHFQQAERWASTGGGPYARTETGMGWRVGGAPGEANGPVFFGLVGALINFLGNDPRLIRWALFPLHWAGLLVMVLLARRFVVHPVSAAMALLVSPHYWVTVNGLLVDALLAPLFMLAVGLWVEGWERDRPGWLFLSGLFQGLAFLTKYTGALAWPLVLVWSIGVSPRRSLKNLAWLMLPVGMSVSWFLFSRAQYGADHFSSVLAGSVARPDPERLVDLLAFAFALTPLVLVGGVRNLALRNPWAWGAVGGAGAVGLWAFGMGQRFVFSVFLIALLGSAGIAGGGKSRPTAWLRFWVLTGLGGLWLARGWVCARYLVVIGAPLVLLAFQSLETAVFWSRWRRPLLGGLALLGFWVAAVDYRQASVDSWAVDQSQQGVFTGRWYAPAAVLSGLPYYAEKAGWGLLSPGERLPKGARLLLPTRTFPRAFWPSLEGTTARESMPSPGVSPFRVLGGGSGFYGSIWGPRFLGWGSGPSEIFYILEASEL